MESVTALLSGWENFYVIVGSSAAALTGLQFVVVVLSSEMTTLENNSTANTFSTPTVVHFCAVLFIAVMLSAPWPTLLGADITLGIGGLVGLAYAALVTQRLRQPARYKPVLEDWICHSVLPMVAYAALLASALVLTSYPVGALFVIAAAALVLLFVGIHNAWDSATFIAVERRRQAAEGRNTKT